MFLCLEHSSATLIWGLRPPGRSYCIAQLQVVDAAGRSDSQKLTNVLQSRTLSGDVSASQFQILSRTIAPQQTSNGKPIVSQSTPKDCFTQDWNLCSTRSLYRSCRPGNTTWPNQ